MKKIILMLCSVALVATACSRQEKPASLDDILQDELAHATTFEDSLMIIGGTYAGAYFNYQLEQPGFPGKIDKKEVERGIRAVMATDTANYSYILGLQMGMSAYKLYDEMARNEKVSKGKYSEIMFATMNLDSIDHAKTATLREDFQRISMQLEKRKRQRAAAAAAELPEARENREVAKAAVERIKKDPQYKDMGQGIYKRTVNPGDTVALKPTDRVGLSYRIVRLSGGPVEEVQSTQSPMLVGNPGERALKAVLPLMHRGESAEFFVPYELAYGEGGDDAGKYGPCESLIVAVTVAEAEEK